MIGRPKRLLAALSLLLVLGCHKDSPSHQVSEHGLRYFGFAAVDTGKTNLVDEIAGFANVGQMVVYSLDDAIGKRLAAFAHAGVKGIVHIEAILFNRSKVSTLSGTKLTLRPDAETRWRDFVNLNQDVLTPQYVAAIYVVDEPAWNGVSLAHFTRALRIVKTSLPNLPTAAIEAWQVVKQIMVPNELDWVGFDRYETKAPEHDKKWRADLETVRAARTRPDQKLVILACTRWLPFYQTEGKVSPADMAAVIDSYYRVAASDPDVIALVGYLWPGGLDNPAELGARDLPDNVQKLLRQIGRKIIRKE